MPSSPKMLMVDTCVWLDYCLPGREGHRTAMDLVSRCYEQGIQLLIAATSTKDVFYVVCQSMRQMVRAEGREVDAKTSAAITKTAWALIDNIMQVATPAAVDTSDVWMAQRHEEIHGDLEDDLLISAALRCGADFIITRDKELIADSLVAAVSPERLLAVLG